MYVYPFLQPEPSAELLMNMSRSRRLIILLSYAYLEQEWCCANFRWDSFPRPATRCQCCRNASVLRQGLVHLLELCQRPAIVIVLEGQSKRMRPDIKRLIGEHRHRLTVLTWRHNSVVRLGRRREKLPATSQHCFTFQERRIVCIFFASLLFRSPLLSSGRS